MREATRADRPKGFREAQCPLCWRLFGSDSTCEEHKPYRRPVSTSCKEPSTVGLEARERRGLAMWVHPMPKSVYLGLTSKDSEQPGPTNQPHQHEGAA